MAGHDIGSQAMTKTSVCLAAILVLALSGAAVADWDDGDPAKWVQYPDLSPMGLDVSCTYPLLLADDFLCEERGLITDIHIWGSWWQDYLPYGDPGAVVFILSIHADIPDTASPSGHSMPGPVLWWREFQPGEFTVRVWEEGLTEGWYEPPDVYEPLGDTICWQYNFTIDPAEAFEQLGSPDLPVVYWLDVQARPLDEAAFFGWKTSLDHWNDDATWAQGEEPYAGDWLELRYPPGHEMQGQSIDLAFVITSEPVPVEFDWGDAPDPSYPTLAASNGARHVIVQGFQMGAAIDAEADGLPDPNALGDDTNNVDDEDGVIFTSSLVPGSLATVDVDMTASIIGGRIDAYIDFDGNGSWLDSGEWIIQGGWAPGGAVTTFGFAVPASATPGVTLARFRLSSAGWLPPTGQASDGEVEDYSVVIEEQLWKWYQPPDLDDTGMDINGTAPFILADDYLCTEPGRVTEIYVFASWLGDWLPFGEDPEAVDFTLSIHADIPADTTSGVPYSMPGEVLWFRDFVPGEFSAQIWQENISEGWMTPPDDYVWPGDSVCWLYMFSVPYDEAFHQVGMPDSAIVYWLDVQARPHDPDAIWGWKTSSMHWNDDAVWGVGAEPYPGPWEELRYPPPHPWAGQSIDLAFGLESRYGTGVPDEGTPEKFNLGQNVPNPFNPKTTIRYEVPAGGGHVAIEIYDVSGRLVRTLVDREETEGAHEVAWDGRDAQGRELPSGVYFYRMRAPGVETTKKALLLK